MDRVECFEGKYGHEVARAFNDWRKRAGDIVIYSIEVLYHHDLARYAMFVWYAVPVGVNKEEGTGPV